VTIVNVIESAWADVAGQFDKGHVDENAIYSLIQEEILGVGDSASKYNFPSAVWFVSSEGPEADTRDSSGRERQFTTVQIDFRIDGRRLLLRESREELDDYMAVARLAKMYLEALPTEGPHRLVSWQYLPDTFGIDLVLQTVGRNLQSRRVLSFTLTGSVC